MYSDDAGATEPLVEDGEHSKGQKQDNACRDPIFAGLYYVHLITVISLAFAWGVPAYEKNRDEEVTNSIDYKAIFYVCSITALTALLISIVTITVMMLCVEFVIKIALLWTLVVSAAVMVWCIVYGQVWGAIFAGIALAVGICYAKIVWSRIPFAAQNLKTGFAAIKSNLGIMFYAYMFCGLSVVYTLFWSLTFMGIYYKNNGNPSGFYIFLLFLGLFWTQQVIGNTIHVSIAGLVGSWWYDPSTADSCCSPATHSSVFRASTYSFGSIAFGSLLVAIIQALRQIVYSMRANGDNAFLTCILDCILGCIEGTLRYFNKWAFVYVGLYGYTYLESSARVLQLFEARGFTVVITDDLVSNALTLNSLVIGLLNGAVALAVKETNPDWFTGYDEWGNINAMTFFLGFVIGILVSNIMLSVVSSAVDTVIVCWAEGPGDLEVNHPEEFSKMRDVWYDTYPDCCPPS